MGDLAVVRGSHWCLTVSLSILVAAVVGLSSLIVPSWTSPPEGAEAVAIKDPSTEFDAVGSSIPSTSHHEARVASSERECVRKEESQCIVSPSLDPAVADRLFGAYAKMRDSARELRSLLNKWDELERGSTHIQVVDPLSELQRRAKNFGMSNSELVPTVAAVTTLHEIDTLVQSLAPEALLELEGWLLFRRVKSPLDPYVVFALGRLRSDPRVTQILTRIIETGDPRLAQMAIIGVQRAPASGNASFDAYIHQQEKALAELLPAKTVLEEAFFHAPLTQTLVPTVLKVILGSQNDGLRLEAIRALGSADIKPEEAAELELLLTKASEPSEIAAILGVIATGKRSSRELSPTARDIAQSILWDTSGKPGRLRFEIAEALANRGDSVALAALKDTARGSTSESAINAAKTLGRLSHLQEARNTLLYLTTESPDPLITLASLRALSAHSANPEVTRTIAQIGHSGRWSGTPLIEIAALELLEGSSVPIALEYAETSLGGDSDLVIRAALQTLRSIGNGTTTRRRIDAVLPRLNGDLREFAKETERVLSR
jgi:hypothetical protein